MPPASTSTRRTLQGGERAFTLIELLVVMIIIAVLMAVAVPTFLSQKSTASKTKAMENIKLIVQAAEACAANQGGSYTTCLEHQALTDYEPSLKGILDVWTTGDRVVGEFDIDAIKDGAIVKGPDRTTEYQGFVVATWIQDGDHKVFFSEAHLEDGRVINACGVGTTDTAAPAGGTPNVGSPVPDSRVCPKGRWTS